MVLGATTYSSNAPFLSEGFDRGMFDGWITRMFDSPVTVLSSRLTEPLDWPNTTTESGDPAEVVARLKADSDVPLRPHGSLTLNRALLNAGLTHAIEVTVFPRDLRRDRRGPYLRRCGGLRPRPAGCPDLRRPHPGADLPSDPTRLIRDVARRRDATAL